MKVEKYADTRWPAITPPSVDQLCRLIVCGCFGIYRYSVQNASGEYVADIMREYYVRDCGGFHTIVLHIENNPFGLKLRHAEIFGKFSEGGAVDFDEIETAEILSAIRFREEIETAA